MSILDIALSCLGIVLTSLEPAVQTTLALMAVHSRNPRRQANALAVLRLLQHRGGGDTRGQA